MKLRPYQNDCLEAIKRSHERVNRSLVACPTGTGKTVIFATHIDRARQAGTVNDATPAVIIAHREELLHQAKEKLHAIDPFMRVGVEQAGSKCQGGEEVIVASVQTIGREGTQRLQNVRPSLIIIDECFPAGTVVDGKAIEQIQEGDIVSTLGPLGLTQRRVIRTFKRRRPDTLVRVTTETRSVVCTPEHPFFCGYRWVKAADLLVGTSVITEEKINAGQLLSLQYDFHVGLESAERYLQAERACLLHGRLQTGCDTAGEFGANGPDEPETRVGPDENEQPNERPGSEGKDESNPQAHWASTASTRGKWYRADSPAGPSLTNAGLADGVFGCNPQAEGGVSRSLQTRHSGTTVEGWDRSGRWFSLQPEQAGARPQERSLLRFDRVERVEILKPRGDGTFGGLCPGGYVYNIEVEDFHNYIANGFVVHNCHHAAASSYGIALRNLNAFHGTKVLGFTATPKRLDKQAIHSMDGAVFQEVAFNYSIRQAIADGWLCQIRGYRVQTDVNLDDLRTVAGDWVDADVAKAVDTEKRTIAAISRWREVAGNRKTIVFCASVEHAYHAASLWDKHAKGVEVIHGKVAKDTRQAAFHGFKNSRTQVLCNVDIATEGFDCPDVSCVVMLRPTQSWARYVQCVGRGTRIFPGKEDLIVIDVVDNCRRHSLATVPAILDLPPGLDLKGKTLEEAAKKLERLGGAGGALLARVEPKDIDEVDSLLEKVDLLANIETPETIAPLTRNNWLQQPNGGLFLACGEKEGTQLTAWLNEDALGMWHLKQTGVENGLLPLGADLPAALRFADSIIRTTWPESGGVTYRESKWRRSTEPPTEKQVKMLRYLGYNADAFPNLTKALASNLISQGKAKVA